MKYYTDEELKGLQNYLVNRKALPKRINDYKYYPSLEHKYLTANELKEKSLSTQFNQDLSREVKDYSNEIPTSQSPFNFPIPDHQDNEITHSESCSVNNSNQNLSRNKTIIKANR